MPDSFVMPAASDARQLRHARSVGQGGAIIQYKVVETSIVTDEELERILNEWTAQGWRLESMQFAMRDSSPRPAMVFVTFTREDEAE